MPDRFVPPRADDIALMSTDLDLARIGRHRRLPAQLGPHGRASVRPAGAPRMIAEIEPEAVERSPTPAPRNR